jgi:4-hydroxybenzoate polyprenyltransferase
MSGKIKSIIELLRIRQYYKNVLIFAGIFFSERLFDLSLYVPLIIGFIILCATSSFNYIINDIIDIEYDKRHVEKLKKKPLASGKLSITFAIILLIIIVAFIVFSLLFIVPNFEFTLMIILIIITGQSYNHIFKNYAFIDVIILSLGYLWRALSGCLIINQYISAWLFLVIFEIAMFLSLSKRTGDLNYLGEKQAVEHKKVFADYNLSLLNQYSIIVASSLFLTYALYIIFKFRLDQPGTPQFHEYIAIFTIPLLFYIIMRYMFLTSTKPAIARSPEKVFFDKGIIIAGLIFLAILFITFYFDEILVILRIP